MVWIALFAGYGGTSNLAYETLRMIRKDFPCFSFAPPCQLQYVNNCQELLQDPKLVKLFRADPLAFMLEAARIRPPVGGMNPVQYRKPKQITFPSIGKTWSAREGLPQDFHCKMEP